jgi:hypothetical protein
MNPVHFWARRSFARLALLFGSFCWIEVLWRLTVGPTLPNVEFAWGHYDPTIAALGSLFLFLGWWTWIPPKSSDSLEPTPQHPADADVRTRRPNPR